jgi:translocation and assembly module TamB
MVRVQMRGAPTVEYTDKAHVGGKIELTGGTLDVEGKRFTIDSGTVTFIGDDGTNPTVYATASWDAGDGTHVYADFAGPLKTGTLTLRSDPSLSQNEILALILFGSTDGLNGSTSGGGGGGGGAGGATADTTGDSSSVDRAAAGAGIGVGGAVATQGLNKALGQLTSLDVSTRIDTSNDTPRFDVVWQLGRNISAQLGAVLGTPAPGTNPDLSYLSIDWRFLGQWSFVTTVGDAGTSLVDLLWRHRY